MCQAPSDDSEVHEQMDLNFWAARRTQGDDWANGKGMEHLTPLQPGSNSALTVFPAPSLDPGLPGCCTHGGTTRSRLYNT